MFRNYRGEIFLAFGALAFGFNGTVSKLVLESGLSAWRLTEVRASGAFVLMLIFGIIRYGKKLKIKRHEIIKFIFFGIIGFSAVNAFYFLSIARLKVSIALIVEFTSPIWIALWLRYVRKKNVSKLMWWGLSIGIIGMVLLAQVWQGLKLDGLGLFYALLDAFAMTAYFLLGENIGSKYQSPFMMVWGLGISALAFAIFLPWNSFPFHIFTDHINLEGRFAHHTVAGWVPILWIILMGTVFPYICVLNGLLALSASTSSVIGMLEPIFAGIFAWWWLGEKFNGLQLLGGLIVLVGIYLADKSKHLAPTKSA